MAVPVVYEIWHNGVTSLQPRYFKRGSNFTYLIAKMICLRKKMAYLKTLRCVLYSLPPQNGERPPDTIMYIMTPRLHKSDNGEAWLHFMTSGLMNSNVPHMLMGIISPFPGAPNDRARPKSKEKYFRIFGLLRIDYIIFSFIFSPMIFNSSSKETDSRWLPFRESPFSPPPPFLEFDSFVEFESLRHKTIFWGFKSKWMIRLEWIKSMPSKICLVKSLHLASVKL